MPAPFALLGFTLVWLLSQGESLLRSGSVLHRKLFQEKYEQKNATINDIIIETTTLNIIANGSSQVKKDSSATFVQNPSRKQLLSQVAKALHASKKKAHQQVQAGEGKEKTNENIWNSFWTNQKSGKLIAEPRELALYDEEVDKKGGGVETGEAINAINWRLSHLQP